MLGKLSENYKVLREIGEGSDIYLVEDHITKVLIYFDIL